MTLVSIYSPERNGTKTHTGEKPYMTPVTKTHTEENLYSNAYWRETVLKHILEIERNGKETHTGDKLY